MPAFALRAGSVRSGWRALVFALALVATACGGGDVDLTDCGQDNQTGPRRDWSDQASLCFRQLWLDGQPASATVVEARPGTGLATVEYETEGGPTFLLRVIPSGRAAMVSECDRLGASAVDGKTQLDPLECEPFAG